MTVKLARDLCLDSLLLVSGLTPDQREDDLPRPSSPFRARSHIPCADVTERKRWRRSQLSESYQDDRVGTAEEAAREMGMVRGEGGDR